MPNKEVPLDDMPSGLVGKEVPSDDLDFGTSPKQSAPSQGAGSGFQGNAPLVKPNGLSDFTGKPISTPTSPSASTSAVGVGSKLKADQEQTLKSFAFNKEKALRDAETVKTKEPVNYAKAVVDYNNLIGDTEKKLGYQVDKINSINSEMNSKFNRVNIPSLHPELAAEKNRLYNEKIKANQEYNKLIASRDAMIQKKAQFQGVITDKERKEAQERIDNPFIANFLQSLRSGVGETVEGMKNMGLDDLIPAWMNPEVTNPENFKKQAEEYTKDKKSLIQALEEKAVIDESKVKVENEKREELGQAPIRSYLGQTLGGLTPALLIAAGATATGTIEALPAMNASLFGTMGYGASLAQGYNEARNLGYDKEESYELAKNAARVGGTVQGILGMVMGQAGEALGGLNPYNKAITGSISKNAINQGITDFALKAVGTGAEFSGARVAENIGQKYLNPDLSADKNVLEGGLESFGQGLLLHTTMSAMNAPKQILGKASLINAVSEARSSEDVSDILNTIQESKQNNFITEGMATQLAEKVGKVREAINLVPDSFTDKDVREKATDLILKHQAIEEKLKKTPEGLKPMVEEELKAINVQFEDLRNEQLNKDKEVAKEPTPTESIDYSQSYIVNHYIDSLQRNIDDEIEYEGQKKPRGILGKIADFFTKDDSTYLDNLKDELKGFKENPIKALENRIARYKKYNEKYPDDAYDLSGIEQDLEDLNNYGKVDMEQSMEAAPTEESKGVGEDTEAFTTDAKFKSEPIELSIEPSRVEEPTEVPTTEIKTDETEATKNKEASVPSKQAASGEDTSKGEQQKAEVVEPTEGSRVELPNDFKNGLPKKMVFSQGEWKQEIGKDLSKVGEKQQEEANNKFKQLNTKEDAIQESKAEGVLSREQGKVGEAGSEREGVGQGEQGQEPTKASQEEVITQAGSVVGGDVPKVLQKRSPFEKENIAENKKQQKDKLEKEISDLEKRLSNNNYTPKQKVEKSLTIPKLFGEGEPKEKTIIKDGETYNYAGKTASKKNYIFELNRETTDAEKQKSVDEQMQKDKNVLEYKKNKLSELNSGKLDKEIQGEIDRRYNNLSEQHKDDIARTFYPNENNVSRIRDFIFSEVGGNTFDAKGTNTKYIEINGKKVRFSDHESRSEQDASDPNKEKFRPQEYEPEDINVVLTKNSRSGDAIIDINGKTYNISDYQIDNIKDLGKFVYEKIKKDLVEQPQEATPSTEAKTVEQLRAEEQAELDTKIPNAEKYRVDGKVERSKLTNDADRKAFDEVYDKYDKLITPLLEKEGSVGDVVKEPMSDNELQQLVGRDVFKQIQRSEEQLGEGVVDRNRMIETAKRIQKADKKDKLLPEHIFEALQYETGFPDNWQDLRNAIKKGGIDINSEAIQRQIEVGVDLPKDIVEEFKKSERYKKATPELVKAVEDLLGKPTTLGIKAEPKVEPTPEKVQESKVEQQYQEAISKKSERAKNNAKEKFINDNFDKIVSQLMLENKIKRKC